MAYYPNRKIEILRGDIFFISQYDNEQKPTRPAIVVSNNLANKYSTSVEVVFLTSQEKKPLPTHVEVMCKLPSTALCENIFSIQKERIGDFIRCCTDKEMEKIDKALLISLGIEEKKETQQRESKSVPDSHIEVERNLYKGLYEALLDKLMVRA